MDPNLKLSEQILGASFEIPVGKLQPQVVVFLYLGHLEESGTIIFFSYCKPELVIL